MKRAIFELFPHPARLRALVLSLAAAKAAGLPRLARRRSGGVIDRVPGLRTLLELAPEPSIGALRARMPEVPPAVGVKRGRVAFLQGCVQRVFFHQVNAATVAVLAAEGFDVDAPTAPRCCGALPLQAGEDEPARVRAKETIAAFEGYDHIVVNAAGCGSAMK